MNYKQALEWMYSQLPMYQRQGKTAFKKDLTNSLALSEHLNYPEKNFKSIHVAGTNGKGSTSHILASILQEKGYKVGLYTSPHLIDYRERIKINGELIDKKSVLEFIKKNKSFLETHQLSFFEMTVGLAFDYFAQQEIDIAVIEVGLGGRLDSTNIITPEISVITNIGLDHTQFLGETLPEIAFEKAGIIKTGVPVVIGEYQKEVYSVFSELAAERSSPIFVADSNFNEEYKTDLKGRYQAKNVATALKTIAVLNDLGYHISEANIKNGLLNVVKNTHLLGRWQMLKENPKVICDTAHNKEGLIYVMKQLASENYKNLHIVIGAVNDKDLTTILPLFPKNASYYFCKPNIPRGLDARVLREKSTQYDLNGSVYSSVSEAYSEALKIANAQDLIFVGGSTFVVAEVL